MVQIGQAVLALLLSDRLAHVGFYFVLQNSPMKPQIV